MKPRNAKPKQDLAVRIWAELAVIEQGSVGIVRHLQSLLSRPTISERFEGAVTSARHRARKRQNGHSDA